MSRMIVAKLLCVVLLFALSTSVSAQKEITVAKAKTLPIGSSVVIRDVIATAGTDQMYGGFFYIQQNGSGIGVKSSTPVRQGDKVSIKGVLRWAKKDEALFSRAGELEINASSVKVTYGPFPLPKPIDVNSRSLGAESKPDVKTVGRLARVRGKIVYADERKIFVHDGSVPGPVRPKGSKWPKGVQVLEAPHLIFPDADGKDATVTGIVGLSDYGYGPVAVLRPTCEPFLDLNQNQFRDPGEAYIDTNPNGAYDGILISGVPGPRFTSMFDRYGTTIYKGKPFLPKGIYNYSIDGSTIDTMVAHGFNTVVCFDMTPADLATINSKSMKTLPCLRNPSSRAAWMAVKDDNAILGWYIHDEPEGHGVSPAQACEDFEWTRSQDPGHFAGNSHFLLEAFKNYKDCEQWTLSDVYPITSPTASIIPMADILATTHAAHGSVYYPAWQFVQAFVGAPQVLPTPAQLRAETYLALAFHAKGIFFFSYQNQQTPEWQAMWAEEKKLNAELDKFQPFLLLPWWPLDATTSNEAVRVGGFRVGNAALIITVNVTASDATATINLPGIPADSVTLPLENGAAQPLKNRSFTCTYKPYQTRVMLWGSIPKL